MTAIFPEPRATHDGLALIRSLAPDQVEAGLTWLARNDPLIFDATLQAARAWDDGTSAARESEPYCVVCRGDIALFAGHEGWRHYRDGEVAGVTHRVVVGWRPAYVLR